MLRRPALGMVAAISLGAMAPSATSAKPWGWGGYHQLHHGFGIGCIGGGNGYDGCYVARRVVTPFRYHLRTVNVREY
jgi:hypothetical protein